MEILRYALDKKKTLISEGLFVTGLRSQGCLILGCCSIS